MIDAAGWDAVSTECTLFVLKTGSCKRSYRFFVFGKDNLLISLYNWLAERCRIEHQNLNARDGISALCQDLSVYAECG